MHAQDDRRSRKDALFDQLARVGKGLSSGQRLKLLELLLQGERTVEALAVSSGLSLTNASAHLQVLRRAGLVEARKGGTRVWYSIAGDDVARLALALLNIACRQLPDVQRAAADYMDGADSDEPVSREELLRRMSSGDALLIDVRPSEEFAAGHIPGALSVPLEELSERLTELPDDVEVVAYCRGPLCVFAPQAVALLRGRGYAARRLEDGFPEWRLEGLPVEVAGT